MKAVLAFLFLAMPAAAEDWQPLEGEGLRAALTARVVAYDTGARQQWNADGRTLYEARSVPSWGDWRMAGGRYCSRWPPADRWDCYTVSRSPGGLDLAFTGAGGETVTGRYIDLQ